LLDQGFENVAIEVHTGLLADAAMLPMLSGLAQAACKATVITKEQADQWTAEQTLRARTGRLFLALPLMLAAADRP
jgi:hypothetical protein